MSDVTSDIDLEEIENSLSKELRNPETQWNWAIFAGVLMVIPIFLPWYLLTSQTNSLTPTRDFLGQSQNFSYPISVLAYETSLGWIAGLIGIGALGLVLAGRQQQNTRAPNRFLLPTLLAGWSSFLLGLYAFGFFPRGQGHMGFENVSPDATITAQLGPILFLSGAGLYICAIRGFPIWLKDLIRAWGPAIVIVLTIRNSIAEPFRIPSGSMVPTLEVGDHILVSKVSYGLKIPFTEKEILPLGEPEVGDVVVFRYPVEPWKDYIKRIVAEPGDRIKMVDNLLFRNGAPVSSDADGRHLFQNERCQTYNIQRHKENFGNGEHEVLISTEGFLNRSFPETTVPEGQYFVMGDNRHNSEDSRWWGFVPRDNIKGKAKWIWLSYNQCEGNLPLFGSLRGGRFGQRIR